jgi:hypothetical protein
MSSKFKKFYKNAQTYKQHTNNPRELFEYSMSNLVDGMQEIAMDHSIDGKFKAVCLSGIDGSNNSTLVTDKYMNIIVRPLSAIGTMLPDPRDFDNPDDVNKAILLHRSTFLAKSDFEYKDQDPILFGQIVNCYYEKGSISNSNFVGLRFKKPNAMFLDQSYVNLANIQGVVSGPKAFYPGLSNPMNMGNFGGGYGGESSEWIPSGPNPYVSAGNTGVNESNWINMLEKVIALDAMNKGDKKCSWGKRYDEVCPVDGRGIIGIAHWTQGSLNPLVDEIVSKLGEQQIVDWFGKSSRDLKKVNKSCTKRGKGNPCYDKLKWWRKGWESFVNHPRTKEIQGIVWKRKYYDESVEILQEYQAKNPIWTLTDRNICIVAGIKNSAGKGGVDYHSAKGKRSPDDTLYHYVSMPEFSRHRKKRADAIQKNFP